MASYEMIDGERVFKGKTYVPGQDPSPDEVKAAKAAKPKPKKKVTDEEPSD